MSTVTENDLKELRDLINSRFDALEKGQIEIKGQMGVIDARLKNLETSSQKIPDLAEKVGELKNWKQISLALFGALLGGLITYLIRNPRL
ncbi:hypothetical protein [Aphanothece sacrum]|uniref:Uncharacterized protein n=1 Tax=Aphanothece sacrum FPU1 TaxID=1920663 RepID=A0A401INM1_APHSA|nr:hypothetical protein [Aphanothece sacrum]GBF82842.1 hypothetical protein AsFPU1_4276 [Aphanothece sacrum FPU1]GBF85923.1 hypothetical protein AsFPU3_2993 [Aphanothece sacrum FPU3]